MRALVATDGSAAATEGARRAVALLDPGAIVTVLAVSRPDFGVRAGAPRDNDDALDRTVAVLGRDAGRAVAQGDPAEAIVSMAARVGADVVVVTSQRRGTIQRVLLGSVTEHVVRHAGCPVLVVHAAEDEPEPGDGSGPAGDGS